MSREESVKSKSWMRVGAKPTRDLVVPHPDRDWTNSDIEPRCERCLCAVSHNFGLDLIMDDKKVDRDSSAWFLCTHCYRELIPQLTEFMESFLAQGGNHAKR